MIEAVKTQINMISIVNTFDASCSVPVTPYSFEPEYSTNEQSSESDSEECDSSPEDDERLRSLEWCTCTKYDRVTLISPRECLCCLEIPPAALLVEMSNQALDQQENPFVRRCIAEHWDFNDVCLSKAVLRTALLRLKHSVQGLDNFSNLPRELPNK